MISRFGRKVRPFLFFRAPELSAQCFFEGEGTGGGGAGGGGGNNEAPARPNPADIVARYSGDTVRMAGQIVDVERDNYTLRRKRDDLQRELDALKGKVPGEGAVVLTPEQAKAWAAYEKMGKPEDISRDLEAGRGAIVERDGYKRAQALEAAAKAANFKPGLLKVVAKDLDVQMREVEATDAEGKTVKEQRPFVVVKDGDKETLTGLREHFKAQGQDVLDSLDAGEGGQQDAQNGQNNGTFYPAQGVGGGGGNKNFNPAGDLLANKYAPPKAQSAQA